MRQENDWRLTNQERYLKGVTLYWKRYVRPTSSWDHDHCNFCWAKFMDEDSPGVLNEGYATERNYHWVCSACYEDFKDMFDWHVIKDSP